ncbi:2-succinyl-5-enolpyruvyl-6-hydroxy-3-cyclohexene-1-carboxylate synthase [Aeromicrobium sp. CF4.19]|uniref:2-succinyl-5-enolpyruvyl-6-hydroxy-3- cyclohexene-1-carboxylate synthase n=1 Tax=Aeromicrobium sp. CF4.19 TaxID=3373082 RepID=UPI003EE42E66
MPGAERDRSSVAVARSLVERMVGLGATEAVLAPGSRSGPIALALHAADADGLLRLHVRVDEREAGFLALGLAKASGAPVPVVTTSGTAVANLHPAMLEALHADVPVVAVTADRPGHLRGTGANQTTDQRRIFPGVPYVDEVPAVLGGPVHLNLELDEPLVEPVEWHFAPDPAPGSAARERTVVTLEPGPRTVVVAGDDAGPRARILARDARWPLLAEPSSGARTGEALVSCRLLLDSPLADHVERVVSVGHPTLSRPVSQLLARSDVDVVHLGPPATFPHVPGPNVRFADDVEAAASSDASWLGLWRLADAALTRAVDEVVRDRPDAVPLRVARTLAAAVPPGGMLFVGSSHPIRDLDLVARPYPAGEHRLVIANRGLAGIDGTVSSAVGAALARQRRRPGSAALAVMGDLTFLHGAGGLLIGPAEPRPDLTVVVVNDDGGSIFATLEQGAGEYASAFERVYATPTGADLEALCRAHGVPHRRVSPDDLAGALEEPAAGLRVLEVPVPRAARRDLAGAVRAAATASQESWQRALDALGYRE